jgi:hypothetical protein
MTKTSLKLIAIAALSAIAPVLGTTPKAADPELQEIAHYREWTRITPQPVIVPGGFPADTI